MQERLPLVVPGGYGGCPEHQCWPGFLDRLDASPQTTCCLPGVVPPKEGLIGAVLLVFFSKSFLRDIDGGAIRPHP
jgi:hypothetical protein